MRIIFIITLLTSTIVYTQQPIILWDLHGVLLAKEKPVASLIQPSKIAGMIGELDWEFIKDLSSALYQGYFNGINGQDIIDIAQKHNAPLTAAFILAIANDQKIMPGMLTIVNELNQLGYRQQIGSNIGRSSFEILTNPNLTPELAPLFKPLELDTAQIYERIDGIVLKKPDPSFLKNYLAKNSIDFAKQPVLFIDDNRANIQTAKELGFATILFKNPDQLRDKLIQLGIPVTPPAYRIITQKNSTPLYDPALFAR